MKRALTVNVCVHFALLSFILLLILPTQAYESLGERGYNGDPYDARGDETDDPGSDLSRMENRDYNSNPYEVNVEGTDNMFSREDECTPDANGMFGTDEGVEQPLDFYYQVETLPALDDAEQVNEEILNKVETSISETILPSLFLEQCASATESTERLRRSNQPLRRRLETKGLTTNPPDTVLEGVECEGELSNELNECYVVDGTMTLYSTNEIDESFLDGIRAIIRDAMTSGDYNGVDPRLVNVSYREGLEGTDPSNNVGTTTSDSEGGDGSLPVYTWVFIGIGAAAGVLALGVGFSRRRKRHGDSVDDGSFPGGEPVDDGSFPGSPTSGEHIT